MFLKFAYEDACWVANPYKDQNVLLKNMSNTFNFIIVGAKAKRLL
jgi:hypothetical protein